MNNRAKILLSFLAIVFLWDTAAIADAKAHTETAEIQPVEEHNSSAYPASPSNLFAIHHQAESGLNLVDRLPVPHSINDSQNDLFGSFFIESLLRQYASLYLRISNIIDPGLTTKKLIFPFHSFL